MPMRDPDLLASSGTLEGITKCINRSFYANPERPWRVAPETLEVIKPDGSVSSSFIVRKKGRRYRFELVKD